MEKLSSAKLVPDVKRVVVFAEWKIWRGEFPQSLGMAAYGIEYQAS